MCSSDAPWSGRPTQHSHSKACRTRFGDIFREAPEDKHRVEEADRRQNRWLAEQVQGAEVPAKGGYEGLLQAGAPPQIREELDEVDRPYTRLGLPPPVDDNEDAEMDGMDTFTGDMATNSARLVLQVLDREQTDIVTQCEREILLPIRDLGVSRAAYKRERKKALNIIVSDVYSLPRVAAAAGFLHSLEIIPGASLDITVNQETGEPWDFDILENRKRGRKLYEEQGPASCG